jgi:Tfp pilus assembly protein PilX
MRKHASRGVALLVVIVTILVLVILANIIINYMLSQSRLTHHNVSRIQAYYASMAGVNLAYDKLRRNNDAAWPRPAAAASYVRCIERVANDCVAVAVTNCGTPLVDPAFPISVRCIVITVSGAGGDCNPPAGSTYCINSQTHYAPTP